MKFRIPTSTPVSRTPLSSEFDEGIWLVSFMDYDLGYFDEDNGRTEPIENPFAYRV